MQKGKANIVIDGQWGSTGKGKLIGYLALNNEINAAMCDFMSNAGHTFVDDDGGKIVTCQLPTSLVNSDALLLINAGAAITMGRLLKEIDENNVSDRLMIHPHTAIIEEEDREYEAKVLDKISSTLKGCGGSISRKVMRIAKLAKDEPKLKSFIHDTTEVIHMILRSGGTVLLEGAQGFDLSLNHGYEYPFCTSRDVTTMSILNHAAIPPVYLGDVYGSIRTYPIRVGNTYDEDGGMIGYSGPYYKDHKEITWLELAVLSGLGESSASKIVERTTVTNKIRRVFTFSWTQITRFIDVCAPNFLFVNFINHINHNDEAKRTMSELSDKSQVWVNDLQKDMDNRYNIIRGMFSPTIKYIGTGAMNGDMIEI